jgi:superfamily II DNA or RNA helicase/transposase-like protein
LECWSYDDTSTLLLYHLSGFNRTREANELANQVDLILEMAENYQAGYDDSKIAEFLALKEKQVFRWRKLNGLPGPDKYKEYKMSEGFKALLETEDYPTTKLASILCQRLEEFHPFINTRSDVVCHPVKLGTSITSPRQNYKISIGEDIIYSNDMPFSIQVTPAFLHPQNRNAMFSVFRCLFRGDEYLHPQLCSNAYEMPSGKRCFILSEPQDDAINAWIGSYEDQEKAGIITLPTGMGKTVVATRIVDHMAQRIEDFRVLVVTTQKEILNQTILKFRKHTRYTLEEYYCKFYGSTSKTKKCLQKPCVMATAASLHKPQHLKMISRNHFDLIIIDETHHINAETWLAIANKFKKGSGYLLGLTATPFRGDAEKPAKIYDDNFLIKKSLNRGIWEGYLSWPDYRIFSDNTKYRGKKISRKTICSLPAYQQTILNTYMMETPGKKTIGFVPDLNSAKSISQFFTSHGVPSEFLSSKQSAKIRESKFKDFDSGKIQVLFAVGILDEGVDIPNVEVLLQLNKTKSPVKFLQRFGRGLRLSPGKRNVTILDFVENYNTVDAILNLGLFLGINVRNILQSNKYKGDREELADEEGLSVVPAINFTISEAARVLVRNITEKEAPVEINSAQKRKIKQMYKAGYAFWQIQSALGADMRVDRKTLVAICRGITQDIDTNLRDKLRYGLLSIKLDRDIILANLKITEDEYQKCVNMIEPRAFRRHIKTLLSSGDTLEELAAKLSLTSEKLQELLDR